MEQLMKDIEAVIARQQHDGILIIAPLTNWLKGWAHTEMSPQNGQRVFKLWPESGQLIKLHEEVVEGEEEDGTPWQHVTTFWAVIDGDKVTYWVHKLADNGYSAWFSEAHDMPDYVLALFTEKLKEAQE